MSIGPNPNETYDVIPKMYQNRRREKVDPRNAKFIARNKGTLARITKELRVKYGNANKKACKDGLV